MTHPTGPRRATADDASTVVEIMVDAFFADPLWGWAFADADRRRPEQRWLWQLMVGGALRYPWVWLAEGDTSAAVWIPPGGTELTPEQDAALEPGLRDLLGPRADRVLAALDVLDRCHPHDEEHHYLTLLATRTQHRGHGYGLALLRDTLRLVDAEHRPAYLEASNLANVPLYARYGFREHGRVTVPGGPDVVTMWRPAADG